MPEEEQQFVEENQQDIKEKREEEAEKGEESAKEGESKQKQIEAKVKKARTLWLIGRAIFLGDWTAVAKLVKENLGLVVLVVSAMILLFIAVTIFMSWLIVHIVWRVLGW